MNIVNMDEKTYCYFNEILTDYLLFSKDVETEIRDTTINEEQYALFLIRKMPSLVNRYPKQCFDNLKVIIDVLKENISNKETKDNIDHVYNLIEDKYGYDIYNIMYEKKYNNYTSLKDDIIIPVEDMISSIRNDYVVIVSLFNTEENYNPYKDFLCNYNYLLSIKRFLRDYPILFSNKLIKTRVIEILENLKQKEPSYLSEITKIIFHIENVKIKNYKYIEDKYYMETDFISAYFRTFLKYHLVHYKSIDITNNNLLNIVYDLIDNEYMLDKKQINIIRNFLHNEEDIKRKIYKDDKESLQIFINKHNYYKVKLNNYNGEKPLLFLDLIASNNDFVAFIKFVKYYNKDSKIIKQLEENLDTDYKLFNYYLFDENIENVSNQNIKNSINKLLVLSPTIFEEDTIFNKTVSLVNDKKILKKLNCYNINKK